MPKSKLKVLSGTPASKGFSFPAEWTRHTGTWFSWPRPEGISFPDKYHTVPANIAAIMKEIIPRELVNVNVPNGNYQHIVTEHLRAAGVPAATIRKRVRFFFTATNESWCRDHGPAFVVRRNAQGKREFAIVDWGFNAWGGKYPPFDADDAVPTRIAEELVAAGTANFAGIFYPRVDGAPVIMEGGSVEFNGKGTVLTSESCLLNLNRNPHLSRHQIEKLLKNYYGQTNVLWLGEGIVGDDTDGHIDDIARFVDARTIVATVEEDPRDENYRILQDNLRRLELMKDQDGRAFEIVKLPMPGPVEYDGQRLPASYANFYFVNGAALLPTYRNKRNDRLAVQTLQSVLPRHKVVPIDCYELIWGLGSIHCLTQQQPA